MTQVEYWHDLHTAVIKTAHNSPISGKCLEVVRTKYEEKRFGFASHDVVKWSNSVNNCKQKSKKSARQVGTGKTLKSKRGFSKRGFGITSRQPFLPSPTTSHHRRCDFLSVKQPQLAIFTTQFQHETTSMCNLYQPTNFRCVPTHQHLSSLTLLLAVVIVSLPLTRQGLRCGPILSGAHFGPIASLSFQLYVYSHHDRMPRPTLPGHDGLMPTDVTDFLCWYLAERLVTIAWPLYQLVNGPEGDKNF
ncbi:hypothetical protein B0H11DRAFT_2182913 [Mycena galericulata]|nr:hypothetical protein B0H11DRAFT_2182913 [Mycena galericulata]